MTEQITAAWGDLLDAQSHKRALVLVLEDIHWGDDASFQLIDSAMARLSDHPILVIASGRPELRDQHPHLWAEHHVQQIKLGALSIDDSEQLVLSAVGNRLTTKQIAQIVTRAAGNPFFLEELIRAAVANRIDELPASVLAMVQRRLSVLSSEARQALRAASVLGETFWFGAVEALVPASTTLRQTLTLLEEQELIVSRRASRFRNETEWAFGHALIRETAYATLTDDDRRLAHEIAANWLEKAGENQPLILAEHFERAKRYDSAIDKYRQAAELAAFGPDPHTIIKASKRSQACGASGPLLDQLRCLEATAHFFLGDLVNAAAQVRLCSSSLRPGSRFWCTSVGGLLVLAAQTGAQDNVEQYTEELLATTPESDARDQYCMVMMSNYLAQTLIGNPKLAVRFLDRHRVILERPEKDPTVRGTWELSLALMARMAKGNPWEAQEAARRAVECFDQPSTNSFLVTALREEAWAKAALHDLEQAEALLETALAVANKRTSQLRLLSPQVASLLGWVLARQQKDEQALLRLEQARIGARHIHDQVFSPATLVDIARAELYLGDIEAAANTAREILECSEGAQFRSVAMAVIAQEWLNVSTRPAAF
jgi:tetratricopeptide (TPR) repeat protein